MSAEAQRAIDLLVTRWHTVTDLRALADISVDRGGQRQQLSGVLLAQAPGSVRFEALSPFGQPILIAVVHAGQLTAFSVVTNEAVVGEATAETTARLLGLPFEPEDLVAIVSGYAVPPRDVRAGRGAAAPTRSAHPCPWPVPSTSVVSGWISRPASCGSSRSSGGRAAATVTYQRDDEGRLTGFDVSAAERYVTGTVRYKNLATGVGLTPDRFALTLPKDAKTQPIR